MPSFGVESVNAHDICARTAITLSILTIKILILELRPFYYRFLCLIRWRLLRYLIKISIECLDLLVRLHRVNTKHLVSTQQTHNVATTSLQRRCNVVTLQWRCKDVVITLCVCWGDLLCSLNKTKRILMNFVMRAAIFEYISCLKNGNYISYISVI